MAKAPIEGRFRYGEHELAYEIHGDSGVPCLLMHGLLFDSLLNRDLAERSRRGELREYRVVHIASHARLVPSHGVAAHIKLADGDMALADLAALDLDQCLVLLSACDGAAAEVLPGEEVFSLSWAFLAAGARAVLASLWPVGDQAVVALVERFYTALRQHDDAALALAQAQRTLCSESPLAWGNFVVTGLCG